MAEPDLSPLLQALYRGDRAEAERLRGEQGDLDVFDAAAVGDVPRLRELLDEQPSLVSEWSADGFTPLHYAAFFGGGEATRVLVEHGADLEAPARNEDVAAEARPLHSAVAAGRRDSVEVLLEAGADPNARQHGGFTPLMGAEQNGDLELAEILIRGGAQAGGGA